MYCNFEFRAYALIRQVTILEIPNTCFIYLVYGKGTIEQLLKGGMNSGKVSRVSFQCSLGSTYSHAGISKLSHISCFGLSEKASTRL